MEVEKQRMLERAEQVNAYILQNSPVEERAGWINRRQSRKFLDATRDDPHYGIYWASLIDEKSTRPSAAIVREWAHHRAVTNDGGVVFANRDYISFKQITQQAVSLAVQEGVARGWGTINMQGDRRFALAAIEAAKQANVKAEIYELYGPWNLFKRKHTIMPTPPGVNKEQPRVETEDLTTGGAEGAPAEGKRETLERMAKLPNRDVPDNPEQENEDPFAALDNPETDEVDTTVAEQEGDDMVWTDEGKVGPIRTPGPNMA